LKPRERVLAALRGEIPDRVPFVELFVDHGFGVKLLGREDFTPPELAEALSLDGFWFQKFPPIKVEQEEVGGRTFIVGGGVKSERDLELIDLPDPSTPQFWEDAEEFLEKYRGDYAVFLASNIGWDPVLLSLGLEGFSYALVDNPELIDRMVDLYTSWAAALVEAAQKLPFDFIWLGDDIAYKTGLMYSPDVFRRYFLPKGRRVAEAMGDIPWCYHSDGNLMEVMDDLLSLGMNAIHPIEPDAMDIEEVKRLYGDKVTLIGNIDLNYTLTLGSPQDAYEETKRRIQTIGRGGRYILSSANSITVYCKVECVLAMRQALLDWGWYGKEGNLQ